MRCLFQKFNTPFFSTDFHNWVTKVSSGVGVDVNARGQVSTQVTQAP